MASRKDYEMMFQLQAELGSSYTGTFTKAQQQLIAMQKELDTLAKQQADISSYEKQQGAVETTQKKLEVLQQQYNNIQKEIQETGGYSSSLENKLLSKQQQIDKTTGSLSVQEQKLTQMGAALREAGIDTDNLGKASADLAEEIKDLRTEQESAAESAGKFGKAGTQAVQAMHQALAAAGIAMALREIYKAFDDVAKSTMQYESAMSVINATTGATADEMGVMGSTIRKVALDTGLYVNDVAKSAKDLMEVGGDVALAMAQLEKGTNLAMATGTDMGKTFDFLSAVMKTFKLEASETDRVTDSFAYTTVKTNLNLSQLAESYVNVGGSAVSAGIDINELNAILVILSEAGLKGGSAGTGLAGVLRNLSTPTEKAAEELRSLNVELYDAYGASRDMFVIMQELEDALGSLTDEQRKRSQSIIFDNVSLKTWNMISATGIETAIELSNEISGASNAFGGLGQAAGMASVATNNAETELRKMEAAAAELKLVIGEQLTPTLGEAYKVGRTVIGGVTEFIQKNPALIKAITVFIAVIGGVVVAIAAYTVAAKAATLASTALSAAIPGVNIIMGVTLAVAGLAAVVTAFSAAQNEAEKEVRELTASSREQYNELRNMEREYADVCSAMGDTSYEAQVLRKELDAATEAYARNKMTVAQAAEAHKELMDAYAEMRSSQIERASSVYKEEQSAASLIKKLEELMAVEGKTAATKQQILGIVELLNEAMPMLGLAYDEYADALNNSTSAIKALAEAELARNRRDADYQSMLENMRMQVELENALAAAVERSDAAYKEYERTERAYNAAKGRTDEREAEKAYRRAQTESQEASRLYLEALSASNENRAAIDALADSVAGYEQAQREANAALEEANAAQIEAARSMQAMSEFVDDIGVRMNELVEGYNAAYEAALKSVQGQYKLWEEAAEVVATSAETINTGIESQISYWQDYNANLSNLTARTSDIEGLSDVIASFADGSKDSVNAVAGMASASDSELKVMVANWKKLQDEQRAVADSLAELETDFTNAMAALEAELGTTVEAMNLSDEAMAAGRDTMLGYVDGMMEMLPAVRRATSNLAVAGLHGLGGTYSSLYSPNRQFRNVSDEDYSYYDGSHAEGLAYVPYDGYIAELHRGERVLTSEEAQLVAIAPQLMAAFSALSATNAVTAESSGSSVIYEITLAPQYHTAGMSDPSQLDAVFSDNNSNLRDMLIEILEDLEDDEDRSRY